MFGPYYKEIDAVARRMFPGLSELTEVSWEHLISPIELRLPPTVYSTAAAAVEAFYRISRSESYRATLPPMPGLNSFKPKNRSVLMAYDFHTDEDGTCSLVEINTNASGFMVAAIMHIVKSGVRPEAFKPLEELFSSFKSELELCFGRTPAKPRVAIVDDQIPQQKMYPEFIMYRDWFASHGWEAELVDVGDFESAELIYNRSTDFYFESETSQAVRTAYLSGQACVSPNPHEYWLLADKERLIQFTDPAFWTKVKHDPNERAAIERVLIPTFAKDGLGDEQAVWDQRKSLFFKPKRAHGGKSVYRGESVSRKVFERLMQEDILIQKYRPAQRVPTDDPRSVLNNWKFDLRFFVYEDKIQLAAARAYQGQVTNFASQYGGFTFVQF